MMYMTGRGSEARIRFGRRPALDLPERAERLRRREARGRTSTFSLRRFHVSTQQRVVLAVASTTVLIGVASVGVYANFSASATASHTAASSTITLALGSTGAVTNRMTVNATGLVPGDVYYRSVDLINSGGHNLSSINLTTTASPTSLLDTDATNGLQMVLQRCSVAWTEAGSSPNFTYSCSGSTTSVLATRAVIGTTIALSNLTTATAGNTDHLLLTMTFPSTAGNTFQGLTSGLTFMFNGVQ
jgi:spore coat-associated protein N